MALFLIERRSPLPVTEAWRLLTDWRRHGRTAPLTTVTVRRSPPDGGLGTLFVARTRLGPLGFDDPMEVTGWEPPEGSGAGHCRLDKRGRVVTGWARIDIVPQPFTGGCLVRWHEDLRVRGLPRRADPVLSRSGQLLFGRAVDRLLREP